MRTITLRGDLRPKGHGKLGAAEAKASVMLAATKKRSISAPTRFWGGDVREAERDVPVEKPVVVSIPKGDAYHNNFISYLDACWAGHYGVVVTPDIIWFHVMNEVAAHIKDNAEQYRGKFTTAAAETGKTNITMQWDGSPSLLNVGLLVSLLRELVPSDITTFLPEFSTTTGGSRMAVDSAFCEAMTPYYSYSVQMCGIPSVSVAGTEADWELVAASADGVARIVPGAAKYLSNTAIIARDIARQVRDGLDRDFWMGLFSLKQCGSGSQVEVDGWVTRLYMSKPPRPAFVCNFPTHITKVPFEAIGVGGEKLADYSLSCGLMSSKEADGVLVPSFGWVLSVATEQFVESSKASLEDNAHLEFAREAVGA